MLTRKTLFTYLRLIRFPNLFTIPGDILVGGFLVTALPMYTVKSLFPFASSLSILVLISLLLYSFGLVQNDLMGLKEDQKLNRNRPLVTGEISISKARLFAALLLVSALGFSCLINATALTITLLITVFVTVYNYLNQKESVWSPLVMGICRGLNLLLGASLVGWDWFSVDPYNQYLWICMGFHIVYIWSVTVFARHEATTGPKVLTKLLPFCVTLIFALVVVNPYFIVFSAITLLTTLPILKKVSPKEIGQTVGIFIQNLILLQLIWLMLLSVNLWLIPIVFALYLLHGQLSKWFYAS